ncbi:HesA/MoeB/ThiF family protein [Rhodoferax mekongensis]|uniref:Molybdopterin-synthase adenylyltransferase MoeB n=1 Tax=Rhodoferax mekongensis TaxID=3068341 RepID=A0ABZ0B3Q2_9BURK|nr:molybdopterin-synthase adenylyltransferase MoeB [Rhodoferax sp. TBRC 17307]WNO06309.1 molybdopterin-synthase adenylyltransferase MoeB [Rhodoferax sp. TBRC 17307]
MQDTELLRYSRHILLDDIGIEGQERICGAHALIIGAGGLGAPAAMYLAAAGIGKITLIDPDTVDLTNLQRQIIHTTHSVGQAKVLSASASLQAINPLTQVEVVQSRADAAWLADNLESVDVVLDCSDNFTTRQAANKACVLARVPLVSGAAIRFDGQISVYDSRADDAPCYACAFHPDDAPPPTQCSTMGVFSPLVGVIGAMQAAEALKLVLGISTTLRGRLLLLDGLRMEWTEMRLPRNPSCPVCAH